MPRCRSMIPLLCLVLLFGCKSKTAPAPEPKQDPAAEPASPPADPGEEPTGGEGAADDATREGIFPVRASDADPAKLVPAEGDYVVNLKAGDGIWHMVGLREGIGVKHVTRVSEEALRGGVHFDLVLDDQGKEMLAALTRGNVGKRLAWVAGDAVLAAPVVKTAIDSGRIRISCGSKEASCIESLKRLMASRGKGAEERATLEPGVGLKGFAPVGDNRTDVLLGTELKAFADAYGVELGEGKPAADKPRKIELGKHVFHFGKDGKLEKFEVVLGELPGGFALGDKVVPADADLDKIKETLSGCSDVEEPTGGAHLTCLDGKFYAVATVDHKAVLMFGHKPPKK